MPARPDPLDLPLDVLRQRVSAKWTWYPPDVLPMFVAEMDCGLAEPVREALSGLLERADTGYPTGCELSEAFSGFASARYGWVVDPARCRATCDVMTGVALALEAFSSPGDPVVINPPVYRPFAQTILYTGRRVVAAPLGRDGRGRWALDLQRLRDAFAAGARVWLLCSPHNPVGRVWTKAELSAAAELCDEYGVRVISDEVHAPVTLGGRTFTPFASLAATCATSALSVVSAAKAWNLAGLKAALLVAGDDLSRAQLERVPQAVAGASLWGSIAGAAAFSAGGGWLDTLVDALDARVRLLADLLNDVPDVRFLEPEAGALAWLDVSRGGLGDAPAAVLLQRGRLALAEGSDFGEQGAGHVRMTIGCSQDVLRDGVQRLAQVLAASPVRS